MLYFGCPKQGALNSSASASLLASSEEASPSLPTFVIGLREGIEAALIVGIIAAFLRQDARGSGAMRAVWFGVAAAIAICVAVGVTLELVDEQLPHREQEGLESIIAALAVGAVTFMIVWMRRQRGRSPRTCAPAQPTRWPPARPPRSSAWRSSPSSVRAWRPSCSSWRRFRARRTPRPPASALRSGSRPRSSSACSSTAAGVKLNLTRFFRATGVVLVFVAAGLVASALHTAHEAGWLATGQGQALDLSWLVVPGTWTSSLLTGMLGCGRRRRHRGRRLPRVRGADDALPPVARPPAAKLRSAARTA